MKNKVIVFLIFSLYAVFMANCSGSTTTSATSAGTTTTTSTPCVSTPYTKSVTVSSSGTVSHNAKSDCLQSCHASANSYGANVFTVAGTMVNGNGSTTVATAGSTITQVDTNPLTLIVDQCGNFYSSTAVTSLTTSRPLTTASSASGGMLAGSWAGASNPGSCNSGGCHDGTVSKPFVY
ncbi:MAG: hypothetical protein OEV78_08405 [Spirochaetia bacterium]|nr:hypothetical protein [Spirochaetia bacterium]